MIRICVVMITLFEVSSISVESHAITPKVTDAGGSPNNNYMHCLADCLDLSVTKIAQLIDKCHTDVHCWEEALGPKAAACLVECALKKQQEIAKVEDSSIKKYIKCLAKCMDVSATKIAELIDKCHKDAKCWVKALGPKAASCLVKCAFRESHLEISKEQGSSNDYMHCLADCLDLSVTKIAQLIDKCHSDLHCWEEALGHKAAACLVECALKKQQEIAKVEDSPNKNYIKCLADCLHLPATKIAELIDKCHKDKKCWVKALGKKAALCLLKCALEETHTDVRKTQGSSNDYMQCLADCLNLSVSKIAQLIDRCHTDVHCWEEALGPKAAACLVECALNKKRPKTVVGVSPSNDYMQCLADCLDLSVDKIAKLIDKCHVDFHCWEEALGPITAACLVECALKKELPLTGDARVAETVSRNAFKKGENVKPAVNFPFLCLSKCLLVTLAEIQHWYAECHLDWRCWLNKAGPEVTGCLAKCFLEQANIPDAHGLVEHVIKTARVTSSGLQRSNNQRRPFKMNQPRYQIL